MLTVDDHLAAGSTVDVPTYLKRGVGVCTSYTYTTEAWLDRQIKDMAYLKLNALHPGSTAGPSVGLLPR